MIPFGYFIASAAIVLLLAILSVLRLRSLKSPSTFPFKSAVIVIAHPDDETMFFLPTILWLKKLKIDITIVCSTTGDFDGLGDTRKKEFEKVCDFLGVKSVILDDPNLRDGWEMWDPKVAAKVLSDAYFNHVSMSETAVITFDAGGISGHPNHRSVHWAIDQWRATCGEKSVGIFNLETVNIARKYVFPIDLLSMAMTPVISRRVTVVNADEPEALSRTMRLYGSQNVWFRKLFAVFSRYAYINTLIQVQ